MGIGVVGKNGRGKAKDQIYRQVAKYAKYAKILQQLRLDVATVERGQVGMVLDHSLQEKILWWDETSHERLCTVASLQYEMFS